MRVPILLAGIVFVLATLSQAQVMTPTPTVGPTPTIIPPSPTPVTMPPVPPIRVESLTFSSSNPTILSGQTVQLIVTGHMTNGATMPNVPVMWHTSNPLVAGMAPNGIVTGGQAGSAQITATFAGITATTTVMVSATPTPMVSPTPSRR